MVVNGLEHSTTYWFQLAVVTLFGEGPRSAATDFTTGPMSLPGRPPMPQELDTSEGASIANFGVKWFLPDDTGGSPLLSCQLFGASNPTAVTVSPLPSVSNVQVVPSAPFQSYKYPNDATRQSNYEYAAHCLLPVTRLPPWLVSEG